MSIRSSPQNNSTCGPRNAAAAAIRTSSASAWGVVAEKDVEAQRQLLVVVEQQVMGEVVTSYMNVWSAEAVLTLTQNNERVLRRQLEATRDRFEVGETTRTDVAQSEARVQRAVSARIQAEGELAAARASYEQVIGKLPEGVENSGEPGGMPSSREETVSGALGSNPNERAGRDLRAAGSRGPGGRQRKRAKSGGQSRG